MTKKPLGDFWSKLYALLFKHKLLLFQLVATAFLTIFFTFITWEGLPISPVSLRTFFFGLFCAFLAKAKKTIGQILGRNIRYIFDKSGLTLGKPRIAYHHAILDLIAYHNQIEKVTDQQERQTVWDIIGFHEISGLAINLSEQPTEQEQNLRREIRLRSEAFTVAEVSPECLRCFLVIRNLKDHYLVDELDHVFRIKNLCLPPNITNCKLLLLGELLIERRFDGYFLRFEILRDLSIPGCEQQDNVIQLWMKARDEANERGDIHDHEPFSMSVKSRYAFEGVTEEGSFFIPDNLENHKKCSYYVIQKGTVEMIGSEISLWTCNKKSHSDPKSKRHFSYLRST